MAYNAKTGQYVPDEKMGDFPTYGAGGVVIPSAKDQELQARTDAGWIGSSYADGTPAGELGKYQAKKTPQAVVDSSSAKTDLSKIQTDFQSILAGLQNKTNYNQTGLDVVNSVVDLMKSKGIADTSVTARQQLAQQAGISDYNPSNAESNKKLAEAIMGSKAVGSAMSQMTPGTPEYDSALGKVSATVAKTNPVAPAQAPQEALTSTGTKVSEDPMQAEYDKITAQIDENNNSITNSLNQLRTGAIPLTADQQAVVDSTQRSFDNAIKQQQSANKNQENIVTRDAFRGGSEYTPAVSSSIIKNVIDANVLKISEYDQKAIAAVAQLKQDFKDANYKAIKEGYDSLQKTLKDKQDNMLALMKLSHDYEKESLNYNLDMLKYKETVRSNLANEEIAGLKLQDTIGPGGYDEKTTKYITQLNQAVSNNAAYKTAVNAKTATDNVLTALSQRNGVGDISAINQFQKLIDDGAVTRDQDVVLIKSAQSLYNKLGTKIKGITKGDQLSEELRNEMRQITNQLYDGFDKNLKSNPYINAKVKELELYGVDINDTILSEIINSGGISEVGGKLDVQSIKSQMEAEGRSSDDIYEALRDANLYNKSFNQAGNASASNLRKAIVAQESGGNYKAVNKDSGALGKYQIMPFNLPGLIGLADTPANRQKFLNSPQLQDKAFDALLAELSKTYNGDTKKILAAYYGGGDAAKIVGTKAADRPQGNYPSINQYVNQILNKLA